MAIQINMAKAKQLHIENIRIAREPKLAALDVEFQRALETGADTSSIAVSYTHLTLPTNHDV